MLNKFKQALPTSGKYPPAIWVLFWGSLISMSAQSLVWPFLTIYIREQLGIPLAQITLLFTLQSISSMAATAIIGPAVDHFGRKWAMVASPIISGVMLALMTQANSLLVWAILLMIYAASGVVFRLASHAMIADLIESEDRANAYALMRMGFNIGIAVGPAIGGYLVTTSYNLSFLIAAGVQVLLAIIVLLLITETLPDAATQDQNAPANTDGYGPVFKDRVFMSFWGVYLLIEIAASLLFTLLAVYVKEQYNIPENMFGYIIGTNALMVVLLQVAVTRVTNHYRPLPVMAISALFYAGGMAIFALGRSFPAFWLGMVVMTLGELMLAPTSTALVADLAPADMRGRYMGLYTMSYRVGSGIGPVMGGWLNDNIAPAAIWYFGMVSALAAAGGFGLMIRSEAVTARKQLVKHTPKRTTL